ncbi:MAG: LysR family transcriptional regulator [Gammaproteobacteria bacterium]
MHVTLRQLQVFEAVARHLNFTRAAEELHLSQPAVSMQVRQFEDAVGLPLFEQLGKRIYLTDAGREMFGYSRSIARLLTEADEVMEQLKGVRRGHLTVSVASTANYFATRLLAAFVQRNPSITFSLDVTNRETLLRQLENNERDVVIMGRPPQGLDLAADPFMENPLVIVAPPGHPLVTERAIPLERLQSETFVVREQGSGTRIAMERFFAERGVTLTTGMEMSSNEAIKQAVEAGLGLGIVSMHTMELELETRRLVVLDVQAFPIPRHWYVVHRQGKRLSPVAQAFKNFVLEEAPRFTSLSRQFSRGA